MRHLDIGPPPAFFSSVELRRLLDELVAFHREGGARTKQVRGAYEIVDRIRRHFGEHLGSVTRAFDGLCAYTEQSVSRPALVTHRPEADAQDVSGEVSPDHYWWLVGEWENWNLVEAEVGRRKGSLFPTIGDRARPPTGDEPATTDQGVLLDPRVDHPQWWLRAMPDGSFAGRVHPDHASPLGGEARSSPSLRIGRGELTISSLDLNNVRLAERRADAYIRSSARSPEPGDEFQGYCNQRLAQDLLDTAHEADGRDHVGPEQVVHLAAYLVPLLIEEPDRGPALRLGPRDVDHMLEVAADIGAGDLGMTSLRQALDGRRAPRPRSRGVAASPTSETAPDATDVTQYSRLDDEVLRDEYITRIEIRDFRCLDHVVIDLSDAALDELEPATDWAGPERRARPRPASADTVIIGSRTADTATRRVTSAAFLGENGSGKSSLLQAVGLCLAGDSAPAIAESAGLRLADLVRRATDRAEITLTFSRGLTSHLSFGGDDGDVIVRRPRASQLLVRGLGASRAAARGSGGGAVRTTVDVVNLFDPRMPALDVDAWAAELRARDLDGFNVAASTLKDVLGLTGPERELDVVDGELAVDGEPLRLLSDGYRALISLVCAVMAGTDMTFSESDAMHGVVLVDEIGAHLHPRWRMDVTRKLRQAFPQVQLLLTTHEPLCLRGMHEREVVRVVRPRPGVPPLLEAVERSPSDFRVDQLLTSEFFGLSTTIDPELQRLWDVYHARAAELADIDDPDPARVRAAAAARDAALAREREFDADHTVLGSTRRAQLAYEVIDEYLAREPTLREPQRLAERRRAIARATELYRPSFPTREPPS